MFKQAIAAIGLLSIVAISISEAAIEIGAFNAYVYGKSKASKPDVVAIFIEIVQRYDIVLLQEIRDSSESVMYEFLDRLNREQSNYTYDMILGPREGRSSSKEQYVYIYRVETVEVLYSYTYEDTDDVFERSPLIAHIKDLTAQPIPDVVLVGIHVKPSDAEAEIDGLVKVYEETVQKFFTFNVLLMGDMNADCSYVKDNVYDRLYFTTDSRFLWLIDKLTDTTVAGTHCAYDRFVATLASKTLVPKDSINVFKFDEYFHLNATEAKRVSDHYPIELRMQGIFGNEQ